MPMGTWAEVGEGDVIQSKGSDPVAWKVTGRPKTGPMAGGVVIERSNGERKVLPASKCPPNGKVMILLSMKRAMDNAIALTQVSLGGKVHAIKLDGEAHRVPVDFVHPGELLSHLWLLHGKPSEAPENEFAEMVAEHALAHHPSRKDSLYVDHIHDPQFLKHLERLRAGEGLR